MKFERNIAGRLLILILILEELVIGVLRINGINPSDNFYIGTIMSELIVVIPAILLMGCWYIAQLWKASKDDEYEPIGFAERLMFKKVRISTLLITILFMILTSPLIGLANVASQFFVKNAVTEIGGDIVDMPIAVGILLIAVMPAMCEEFALRGVVYGGYRRSCKPFPAIVVSGLLFGLMHMNLNQFMYAFILGVLFAMLNEASGSIWTSILAHLWVNGTNVFSLYMVDSFNESILDEYASSMGSSYEVLLPSLMVYALLTLVTIMPAMMCLRWIARREGNEDPIALIKNSKYYKGIRIWTPALVISIIYTIYVIIAQMLI